MNKFFNRIACGIAAVLLAAAIAGCNKSNPESDFEVVPEDGGQSVVITDYLGDKWEVNIPSKIRKLPVTRIGSSAFRNENLTSVTIPDSVTEIWGDAFRGNQLTKVTIPNSVTLIQGKAFADNQLTSVTIGNGVTDIWSSAFDGNPLTSFSIDSGNTEYSAKDLFLLSKDGTQLIAYFGSSSDITIPAGVTVISDSAFREQFVTGVTFPNSVTTIEDYAFYFNQITSVVIPDSVTSIGRRAFAMGHRLTSVTIGANVQLGDSVFSAPDGASHRNANFERDYANSGRAAGTYTRVSGEARSWTRQ